MSSVAVCVGAFDAAVDGVKYDGWRLCGRWLMNRTPHEHTSFIVVRRSAIDFAAISRVTGQRAGVGGVVVVVAAIVDATGAYGRPIVVERGV